MSQTNSQKADVQVTDEEAKVYDRQIRLWGLQAQQKIRAADVLLVGLEGLASEVVKNLVLVGINSITLIDDHRVSDFDMLSNLFSRSQVGINRAEAMQKAVRELNPMVTVNARTISPFDLLANKSEAKEYIQSFNVVIMANRELDLGFQLNQICHECEVPFFAAWSWGYLSMVFCDLGKDFNGIDFVPISEAFAEKSITLRGKSRKDRLSRVERNQVNRIRSIFLATLTLFKYQELHGEFPSLPDHSAQAPLEQELVQLEQQILRELNQSNSTNKNDKESHDAQQQKIKWLSLGEPVWPDICGHFSFIGSIVGGFLSQEVISAITHNPIDYNLFLFNHIQGYNVKLGLN